MTNILNSILQWISDMSTISGGSRIWGWAFIDRSHILRFVRGSINSVFARENRKHFPQWRTQRTIWKIGRKSVCSIFGKTFLSQADIRFVACLMRFRMRYCSTFCMRDAAKITRAQKKIYRLAVHCKGDHCLSWSVMIDSNFGPFTLKLCSTDVSFCPAIVFQFVPYQIHPVLLYP